MLVLGLVGTGLVVGVLGGPTGSSVAAAATCAPAFTNPTSTAAVAGMPFSFPVTTCGVATSGSAITVSPLPDGLAYHTNGDGTGVISGTPQPESVGADTVTLRAFVEGDLVTQQTLALSVVITALPSGASVSPPASVASDCSTDVTTALNAWLATVPSGSTIVLPVHGCYLVSNSATTLTLDGRTGLTFVGNGTTFEQTSYACGSNELQPVLTLTGNTNLTFDNLTVDGPGTCGGAFSEGDYGILLGQSTPGNTDITFNDVTVNNTDGDGLAIYPELGTCCGINTNIRFQNGAMSNIGYHTITPEGVNGLAILNNRFVNDGNFMDMEVDNDGPGNGATPVGVAQWNITVKGNTFTQGAALNIDSLQGACVPQRNVTIAQNTLTASSQGLSILLGGSGAAASSCPRDSGLTIVNNSSLGPAGSPCGGSIASPPGCSMIEIADYSNVRIQGNTFTANDGEQGYFENTIWVPCITLQGVAGASIVDNACTNAYDVWDSVNWQFQSTDYVDSGISACGNTFGLSTLLPLVLGGVAAQVTPESDAACAVLG